MESKKIRDLMEAYSSIYEEKEESEMEKNESGKDEGGKHKEGKHPKGKEEKGEKVTEKEGKEGKETEKEMKEGVSYSAKAARAGKDIGKPGKAFGKIAKEAGERYGSKERGEKVAGAVLAKLRKEEFEGDLFDYILEHLVAEGYADTNKAALAIMANMSEDWKQSIVEADSLAAQQARREERLRRQRKREGRPSGGGDFGHDYGKPRAQADAEREQRMKDFINKKD
jgi:hypothetical protein